MDNSLDYVLPVVYYSIHRVVNLNINRIQQNNTMNKQEAIRILQLAIDYYIIQCDEDPDFVEEIVEAEELILNLTN